MSMMTLVAPELSWTEHVVVRMLRRWSACRAVDEPALARLVELAGRLGVAPEVAVAAGSLFQITESCLERPLIAERCHRHELSADERATLALIAAAPSVSLPVTSAAVPHGLPGVLIWAATSVRVALGEQWLDIRAGSPSPPLPASCPFAAAPQLNQ